MTIEVWMLFATAAAPLLGLGVPGLVAWGGMRTRVAALEQNVNVRVSRELFDVHVKNIEKELAEIKALLMISTRRRAQDDTNPGT